MKEWLQDIFAAGVIVLLLYSGLMYGYVLQGIVQ
jgi:hypothetical protein